MTRSAPPSLSHSTAEEDHATLFALLPPGLLARREELHRWAALFAEALEQGARFLDVVACMQRTILARARRDDPDEAEELEGLAARFRPLRVTSSGLFSLVFEQEIGAWPNEVLLRVELDMSERDGLRVRHSGFPAEVKQRRDSWPKASAVEQIREVLRLFLPYQEPFPGTVHAGRVLAVLKTQEAALPAGAPRSTPRPRG